MSDVEREIALMQASSLAEFGRLDDVARAMLDSGHGRFVRLFAQTWLQGSVENKRLLKPTWAVIIEKYGLEEDLEEEAPP